MEIGAVSMSRGTSVSVGHLSNMYPVNTATYMYIPLWGTNRTTFNMSYHFSGAGTYKADYGSDKVLSSSGTSGSFGRSLLELNDGALCLGMCCS